MKQNESEVLWKHFENIQKSKSKCIAWCAILKSLTFFSPCSFRPLYVKDNTTKQLLELNKQI